MKILDTKEFKLFRSEEINYNFDKNSGYMETWGKTLDDDPDFSPYGPFILDVELSTICKKGCAFCFDGEEMVSMADGHKLQIKYVEIGDKVQGVDLSTGKIVNNTVVEVYSREYTGDLVLISLESGEVIRCTPDHIFYTEDLKEVAAKDLTLETKLFGYNYDAIYGLDYDYDTLTVYNLHCSPNQNYFVDECLTHNCYKNNIKNGKNMNLENFIKLFNKLPKTLTQIAYGLGDIDSNPDLFNIMEYTRSKGVIPNITINGSRMTPEYYDKLASLCGAVAVSYYDEESLNAVYELTKRGMKFVNIHMLLSKENLPKIVDLLNKYETDYRLANMNAIVFLSLKQKGRGVNQHPVNKNQFNTLLNYLFENNIRFGADSCLAQRILSYLKENNLSEKYSNLIEPCESFGLLSGYINCEGIYFPCSFIEGMPEWEKGLSVLDCNDFISDIWYNPLTEKYRKLSLACKRSCLFYEI